MLEDFHRVCFTGHRPKGLCGYDSRKYTRFAAQLQKFLGAFCTPDTSFLTGGAQGFDQLAFWSVNRIRQTHPDVRNIVYVPFHGQEKRWAEDSAFGQKEYRLMLRRADQVVYLDESVTKGMPPVQALMTRNHAMVDSSDCVIAMYNGDDWKNPGTRGGTAECMRYAAAKGKPIFQTEYKTDAEGLYLCSIRMIEPGA